MKYELVKMIKIENGPKTFSPGEICDKIIWPEDVHNITLHTGLYSLVKDENNKFVWLKREKS